MPTELRDTVKPMAKHSSKWQRSMAPAIVRDAQRKHEAANCQAARRAKNIADAKARDKRIKESAALREKQRILDMLSH